MTFMSRIDFVLTSPACFILLFRSRILSTLWKSIREFAVKMGSEFEHRNPFEFMKISDNRFLDDLSGRSPCIKCGKSRKFFCYTCHLPTAETEPLLPKVHLPLKIDIIKHPNEKDGKSTAIHAAILAPAYVSIYTYPDIPNYDDEAGEGTILIFPSNDSEHVNGIFDGHLRLQSFDELTNGRCNTTLLKCQRDEVRSDAPTSTRLRHYTHDNLPIKRAVFIDSTWDQCKGIYKDTRINKLRPVVLQHRLTQFWRHQRNSPRWFLATIEAIHQFLLEVHINAWGLSRSYCRALQSLEIQLKFVDESLIVDTTESDVTDGCIEPYNGQYDDLMFFYSHIYQLINKYYDRNDSKTARRPIK